MSSNWSFLGMTFNWVHYISDSFSMVLAHDFLSISEHEWKLAEAAYVNCLSNNAWFHACESKESSWSLTCCLELMGYDSYELLNCEWVWLDFVPKIAFNGWRGCSLQVFVFIRPNGSKINSPPQQQQHSLFYSTLWINARHLVRSKHTIDTPCNEKKAKKRATWI